MCSSPSPCLPPRPPPAHPLCARSPLQSLSRHSPSICGPCVYSRPSSCVHCVPATDQALHWVLGPRASTARWGSGSVACTSGAETSRAYLKDTQRLLESCGHLKGRSHQQGMAEEGQGAAPWRGGGPLSREQDGRASSWGHSPWAQAPSVRKPAQPAQRLLGEALRPAARVT